MKKKLTLAGIIILAAVVALLLPSYHRLFAYTTYSPTNIGLCYNETWQAADFYVLKQRSHSGGGDNNGDNNGGGEKGGGEKDDDGSSGDNAPSGGYEFYYTESTSPRTSSDQKIYDFIPVKWEVTGVVSYAVKKQ